MADDSIVKGIESKKSGTSNARRSRTKKTIVEPVVSDEKHSDNLSVNTDATTAQEVVLKSDIGSISRIRVKKQNIKVSQLAKIPLTCSRATGRRKSAVAKVWLWKSDEMSQNSVSVNGLCPSKYFSSDIRFQREISMPFEVAQMDMSSYSWRSNVHGGGKSAQSGAVALALSLSLAAYDSSAAVLLRSAKFLTRDNRRVQSKNTGLRKARKAEQFSKR